MKKRSTEPRRQQLKSALRFQSVIRIFEQRSSEDNPLSVDMILDELTKMHGDHNVRADTIRRDINRMKQLGYVIEDTFNRETRSTHFYLRSRKFDLNELRMMIDAVSSFKSIPSELANVLVEKLKQLTELQEASTLSNQLYIDRSVRVTNKNVRYWIESLHRAIYNREIICFDYGKYDMNKNLIVKEGIAFYPYELVWNSDYYYLIGKKAGESQFTHYRVDRITRLLITAETFERDQNFEIASYMNRLFHMYSGVQEEVILQFHHSLVNVVIDKFGIDIEIKKLDEEHFEIRFPAVNGDGLLRWILTWGADVKVIAPQQLKERVMEQAEKVILLYQ